MLCCDVVRHVVCVVTLCVMLCCCDVVRHVVLLCVCSECARVFHAAGARLVLCGRHAGRLQETVEELREAGGRSHAQVGTGGRSHTQVGTGGAEPHTGRDWGAEHYP